MKTCLVANLGLVEYGAAREIERRLVAARKAGAVPDVLLLCEHPHVITQGRAGQKQNLLASDRVLAQMGVNYFDTDRGGDVTYHGQMCIRDRSSTAKCSACTRLGRKRRKFWPSRRPRCSLRPLSTT